MRIKPCHGLLTRSCITGPNPVDAAIMAKLPWERRDSLKTGFPETCLEIAVDVASVGAKFPPVHSSNRNSSCRCIAKPSVTTRSTGPDAFGADAGTGIKGQRQRQASISTHTRLFASRFSSP